MSKLAEGISKVIADEASGQIAKYEADKTVSGEVFAIVDVATGEYKIRYQGGVWSAFAQNQKKYNIGDNVLVKIPLGDFSKTKYIEGYTYNTDTDASQNASQVEESFSPDWSSIYGKDNWSNEYGLIANYSDPLKIFENTNENVEKDKIFAQYGNQATKFRISAEFLTTFVDAKTKGNYGLRFTFKTSKEDNPTVVYTLDTKDFNGDPYRNTVWAPQSILLTVPRNYLISLESIEFFQEEFEALDPEGNESQANIFCRNLKIEWINITDLTDSSYYLTISSPQGTIFTSAIKELKLQVKLMSGNNSLMSKSSCSCLWYKEDASVLAGSEKYEKIAGAGWLRIEKDSFDTISVTSMKYPATTTNFKVIVIYNKDKILFREFSLYNLESSHDLYLMFDNNILSIKDRKSETSTFSGEWYIELPDGTRKKFSDDKTASIDLTNYLSYPWIKVYCNVMDGSTLLSVLHWTNYHSEEDEELPDFTLQYKGDDVFHYDANGDIYDTTEYGDGIEHILTCEVISSQSDSSTFTMKWLDSDKKEILVEPQDITNSMMQKVWVDKANNSLHFKVKTKFQNNATKNTIYVRLIALDGSFVDYAKDITFLKDGDQGTNGTSFVCIIRPINSDGTIRSGVTALKYQNNTWTKDVLKFKTFIYYDGELISNQTDEYDITYTWKSFGIKTLNSDNSTICSISMEEETNSPDKFNGFYIKVSARIKYKNENKNIESTEVYAYYPVDVCVGNLDLLKIEYAAPQFIKYSSSSTNPQFNNQFVKFTYDNKEGEIKSESELLDITNGRLTPVSRFDGVKNDCVGKLSMMPISSNTSNYLLHSIFLYLNTYGNEAINGWDGTSIEIDNEGNTILAPQIGAGKKNSENQFSGVVMGKDSTQSRVGLYGYSDGINTFALTEDGKASFGVNGQITIDGAKAQITGKNSGSDQYMTINLVDMGNGTYAIQVGNKFLVDYDGNLKCINADVSGKITAKEGRIGDCSIQDGKLEVPSANITGTITAGAIDLDAASISGKLTASNIDVDNLTVANAVNVTGEISADKITTGTLNADRINAGTLSWDKLIGYIPQAQLCSQDSVIDQLYARWASITELSVVKPSVTGTLSLYTTTSTSPLSAGLNGAGVILNGTTYAWSDIVSGATSTTKTAVFG